MERDALHLFARHYKTGEAIPEELFEKMKRARTFRSANTQMRQLGFGMVDLKLHREFDPEQGSDVLAFARDIYTQFSPAALPADYGMIASFTHLFASPVAYGAGYYSYKWAEVLSADAFSLFEERGVFDAETGRRFRDEILAVGGSRPALESFVAFRGRPPSIDALLRHNGMSDRAVSP